MSKARLVITAITVEKRRVSEVARSYGVARSWVYTLLARHEAEGEAAFEPRSRRTPEPSFCDSQVKYSALSALCNNVTLMPGCDPDRLASPEISTTFIEATSAPCMTRRTRPRKRTRTCGISPLPAPGERGSHD